MILFIFYFSPGNFGFKLMSCLGQKSCQQLWLSLWNSPAHILVALTTSNWHFLCILNFFFFKSLLKSVGAECCSRRNLKKKPLHCHGKETPIFLEWSSKMRNNSFINTPLATKVRCLIKWLAVPDSLKTPRSQKAALRLHCAYFDIWKLVSNGR